VCEGQFNGCATVWAAGPREVVLVRPGARREERVLAAAPNWNTDQMHTATSQMHTATSEVNTATPEVHEVRAATREIHTAWPLTRTQARVRLEAPAARAGATSPVPAADGMRGQIFEWLQDSFEGLNAQMRVLADNLNRQQQALAEVSDSHAAAGRLSQLADALPERIGAAVQEAVSAGRRSVAAEAARVAGLDQLDEPGHHEPEQRDEGQATSEQAEEPEPRRPAAIPWQRGVGPERDWSAAVEEVMSDLRRLPAAERSQSQERSPEPEAEHRVPEAELVDAHVGPASSDPGAAATPGLRSQLTSLASTVQTRVNRSGWQEKLRSLSTR